MPRWPRPYKTKGTTIQWAQHPEYTSSLLEGLSTLHLSLSTPLFSGSKGRGGAIKEATLRRMCNWLFVDVREGGGHEEGPRWQSLERRCLA